MATRETTRVLVEQAIARGHSVEHICATLHITELRVLNVMLRMDAISNDRPSRSLAALHRTCRRGLHDLTYPPNVYVRPDGYRECRPCKRLRERQRNHGDTGMAELDEAEVVLSRSEGATAV